MKKLTFSLLTIIIMCSLVFISCSESKTSTSTIITTKTSTSTTTSITTTTQKPIELKLVGFIPDVYPGNLWTNMIIKKVKDKSGGQLTIEFIGGPETIGMADAPAAVQRGTVDMANVVFGFIPAPATAIECLMNTEISYAQCREVGAYDLANEILNKANLFYVGQSYCVGPRTASVYFSNVKIEKLTDFEGKQIACPGPELVAPVMAMKASPVVIPPPDFYTAMERGTVMRFLYQSREYLIGVCKKLANIC